MAIRMIVDSDNIEGKEFKEANKGGYGKYQFSDKEVDSESLALADQEPEVMTVKEFTGDSKGTVPKETVTSDRIEIDNVGKALAEQFNNLSSDKQMEALENIGLKQVKEPTSKEDQERFLKDTNTEKIGFIESAGKAFSNLATKLETNIEKVMEDPGKRAMFYSGLSMIDESSGYKPITQAKSPLGIFASSLEKGVKTVKAEELAKANVESKTKSNELANQLKLLELELKMDEASPYEKDMVTSLNKKLEGLQSSVESVPLFGGMTELVNQRIKSGNFDLPVGIIREKIPVALQAINDLLPKELKQGSEFFQQIANDSAFIGKFNKLNTDIVLSKISNTKLVPVSDKDVQLVQQTVTQTSNPSQVFLATLRSGDAYNYINAKKVQYGDTFKAERGYKRGSKRNFDEDFNSLGATAMRAELYAEFGEEALRNEAKKIGFEPDYGKYSDGVKDYSPFALAEARASLNMGGIDNYKKMSSSMNMTGNTTSVVTGTNTQTNPENWKTNYPNIGKTQPGE